MKVAFEIPGLPDINIYKMLGVKQRNTETTESQYDKEKLLEIYKYLHELERWTPDGLELQKYDFQPLFVYCSMMEGGAQFSVIENIIKLKDDDGLSVNPAVYTRDRFEMWQTKDGKDSYPVALTSTAPILSQTNHFNKNKPRRGRVKGKLYFVSSIMLNDLDKLKQNGVVFRRRKVSLLVPYQVQIKDKIPGIESYTTGCTPSDETVCKFKDAWMYVGRHSYWDDEISRCVGFSLELGTVRFSTPKPWMGEEPYYYFNAWEKANNK